MFSSICRKNQWFICGQALGNYVLGRLHLRRDKNKSRQPRSTASRRTVPPLYAYNRAGIPPRTQITADGCVHDCCNHAPGAHMQTPTNQQIAVHKAIVYCSFMDDTPLQWIINLSLSALPSPRAEEQLTGFADSPRMAEIDITIDQSSIIRAL